MIVGLSGYAGSGKDTVGRLLVERHGFTRLAFADALKAAASKIDPWLPHGTEFWKLGKLVEDHGPEKVKAVRAVREFYQHLGESLREQNPDVWVDIVARRIDRLGRHAHYVITDVRFPNEASMVTGLGGEVWRVERPDHGPVNGHVSETALDGWEFDRALSNDLDLVHLAGLVDMHVVALREGVRR